MKIAPDPGPDLIQAYSGLAHPGDLPILVAALTHDCPWLVTLNLRHYRPGNPSLSVLPPGDFLLQVRDILMLL